MERKEFDKAFESCLVKAAEKKEIKVNTKKDRINKIGYSYEGLSLRFEDDSFGPIVNLENLLEKYNDKEPMPLEDFAMDFLEHLLEDRTNYCGELKNVDDLFKKENLISVLVPAEENEDVLKTCPNRRFLNMAIIPRFEDGGRSTIVKYGLLKKLEMTPEEVLDTAIKNTIENGHCVSTIEEEIGLFGNFQQDGDEDCFEKIKKHPLTMVVMKRKGSSHFGANCLLNKEFLTKVADLFSGECFIIPSSIHEVLAIPSIGMDTDSLRKMIADVNEKEVSPEDRLSYDPFFLDKDGLRVI